MNRTFISIIACAALSISCSSKPQKKDETPTPAAQDRAEHIYPGEIYFSGLRQLTFGGENAEAYFDRNGTELIFQSTRDDLGCDQIFRMNEHGENVRMVSTGLGRTTCGYLFPDGDRLIYSSSHESLKTCPPKPDYSRGYVWPLLPDFDIYSAGAIGEDPVALAPNPGYDAEGVISPDGSRILFTSTRSGDIDIWSMAPDGTDLKQLTTEVGYDGGAFFSPDGTKIVWRANYPKTEQAMKDYKALLGDNLVRPSVMNLYVMNADGTGKQKILENGYANFAPYFHPDGKRIVFSSNMDAPQGRDFELYIINVDGTGLQRVTFNDTFDAFPMFSHDGKKLVFASNRAGDKEGDTNVFIADWTDENPKQIDAQLGEAGPNAARWTKLVAGLTTAEMGGRGLGTPQLENAAAYIESQFRILGLEPVFGESFRQTFDVVVSSKVEKASMSVKGKRVSSKLFSPLPFSASTSVKGAAAFVGFGITAPTYDYDDYAGKNLDGKIAVMFRYEPERDDAKSKFAGTEPIRESTWEFKTRLAEHRGATAVVVINPKDVKSDKLHGLDDAKSTARIPVVHLTWRAARTLFGESLEKQWELVNAGKVSGPVDLKTPVEMDIKMKRVTAKTSNVVAKITGKTDKYVVVGAHYDHLGDGGHGSLAPDEKAAHPGADDNASGVATVLELARALKAGEQPKHTYYFIGFTGEESGLLGSEHFVSNPPAALENAVAMFNFDMVGRPKNGLLNIYGTGTAKEFVKAIRRATVSSPLRVEMTADGFGPSDQTPFIAKKIPVLHFFTGLHDDYHRPSDTLDKLDPSGAAEVARIALRTLVAVDATGATYTAVSNKTNRRPTSSKSRGYGPYFGSVPSFGGSDRPGVKISGARPGSPAEKAGLQGDDVIIKFGKFDVTSMQDYAFAIRQHKPGDEIDVVVVRKGKELKLKAKLSTKSGDKKPKR